VAYAAGKYSRAMCDRCGFEMAYSDLIEEWTGFKVCSDCFDTKHPQDFPGRHKADAEILRDARPDNDKPAGPGQVYGTGNSFMNNGATPHGSNLDGNEATSSIGSVTVTTS